MTKVKAILALAGLAASVGPLLAGSLTPPSLLSPPGGGYRAPAGTLAPTTPLVSPRPTQSPGSVMPHLPAPIPPANSGWARPYTAGDGGIGVIGGGQKGNTQFQGHVYVPPAGAPFVRGDIVLNPLPPLSPSRSAQPSENLDVNKR
jgi:hypothetical protein